MLALLRDKMAPEPIAHPELIGISSPAEKGDLSLSLFLYSVKENGESRRTQLQSRGVNELQFPPMAVDLFFLITAYSKADLHTRTLDEHRMIGKAMQVLYDHSILRKPYLQGTLAEADEEVRIVPENLSADMIASIWKFSDATFKLSIGYKVGPIYIDSTRIKSTTRVVDREIQLRERGSS